MSSERTAGSHALRRRRPRATRHCRRWRPSGQWFMLWFQLYVGLLAAFTFPFFFFHIAAAAFGADASVHGLYVGERSSHLAHVTVARWKIAKTHFYFHFIFCETFPFERCMFPVQVHVFVVQRNGSLFPKSGPATRDMHTRFIVSQKWIICWRHHVHSPFIPRG